MKKLFSLLALTAASIAFAAPASSTVQGVGNSTSQNFTVNATVGDACILSAPQDVSIQGAQFWTQSSSTVTGSTSVNVACNSGAPFYVEVGRQSVILTNPNSNVQLTGRAYIDGTNSSPYNAAYTASGANVLINVDVNRPTQDNVSGTYSGPVTVTLYLGLN